MIKGLNPDNGDMPFISMRNDGVLVDFTSTISASTSFGNWRDYGIRGRITEEQPLGKGELTFLWETGVAAKRNNTMKRCNYAGDDCYEVKTVPVIYNLSSNVGFVSGGLNLTVYGNGFGDGKINATADGVPCHVTDQSTSQFSCEVRPKAEPSIVENATYIGQHGMRRYIAWIGTSVRSEQLQLDAESRVNMGNYYRATSSAWFIPPATTRYRFYASCDDTCDIKLAL